MSGSTSDHRHNGPAGRARSALRRWWRTLAPTLRAKVFLSFVAVALAPLVAMALFNYAATRQSLIDSANQALFAAASQTAARLDAALSADLEIIKTESRLPALAQHLKAAAAGRPDRDAHVRVLDILGSFRQKDAVFVSSYALLDLKGRNVADTDAAGEGRDESASDYFQAALDTVQPYVSSVEFATKRGSPYLYLSSAVIDPDTGRPLGVLRVRYGAALLQQRVIQDTGLIGLQSYPLLIDSNGLVLADGRASPGDSSLLYRLVQAPDAVTASLAAAGRLPQALRLISGGTSGLDQALDKVDTPQPYFAVARDQAAHREAAAVTRMKTQPWLVVFLEPEEVLLLPVQTQARYSGALAVLIVMAVAFIAIGVAQVLTSPITHLTAMARHVADGHLDTKAEVESGDEIGLLAEAFNSMTDQLRTSIDSLEQRVEELDRMGLALRESEERYRLVFENSPVSVWEEDFSAVKVFLNKLRREGVADLEGYLAQHPEMIEKCAKLALIVNVNHAALDLHQAASKEQLFAGLTHTFTPESFAAFRDELLCIWQGKTEMVRDAVVKTLSGEPRNVMVYWSVCPGYEQSCSRVLVSLADITERKQAEEALRRYKDQLEETVRERTAELRLARDAAEAANKAKSAFLANMSHELRTPLNAILGFSRMMRGGELRGSQAEYLDIINRSGEHLLTLINDVLEVAKIEAGRVQLDNSPLDLGGLVRDVADMMRLRAQEKGLRLLVDQSSEFPRYIRGDEARLRQILVNLLGNAVKFTEEGGVVIRLGLKDRGGNLLLIEVEDSGPGISPADQARIFRPFVQLAEGAEQKGTGLGLSITRQFVELMGGTIGVESVPGKGSCFRVELPVELASFVEIAHPLEDAHKDVEGLAPGQPSYRILIAEDQQENQLLLQQLMTRLGLETRVVENGAQSIDAFEQWHPDLIWMDRRMPVMDGLEATRRIRRLPGGDKVKIIAVTASAFKEQQQELLGAGMDDFVSKPYRFSEIYDCLARQLGLRYLYRQSGESPAAAMAPLTADMLSGVPLELRQQLKAALESLESERIDALLARVGEIAPGLAAAMHQRTKSFDYPAILHVLQAAEGSLQVEEK